MKRRSGGDTAGAQIAGERNEAEMGAGREANKEIAIAASGYVTERRVVGDALETHARRRSPHLGVATAMAVATIKMQSLSCCGSDALYTRLFATYT